MVNEWERAILFNLGKIQRTDIKPGLHFKVPVYNNVQTFDGRIRNTDVDPESFLTSEKKNVIVDFFVKWKIDDVKQFYVSTRGEQAIAGERLSQILKNGLRNEFARRTIREAVSGERNEIMQAISLSSRELAKELGIEVVDVRISRIELPKDVSDSVYDRMRAERGRIARELRAEGDEAAERIQSEADRQRTVILAEAYKQAQELRGAGDAGSAEIYANAYGGDAEFYKFYRSLESYRKSFQNKGDMLVLDPASDFFRYFNAPQSQ
jgi:membrane protease subunit HflC